ncbi:hypothetical protein AN639_01565 [Candidatus Epulonipiscium fishelsonii]|uniref:Uncharacterized protein n=1 Tax=Candidatus Epulonipiscium fishelsonii TaxID=77094 RepID=A0ACC8XBL5_9FIRM|nr:hypothetical protein AN639_01565 [Epulopiscium sp. SCG-B05WGA-EpuloA1]ONI39711.1 hypothetical protein AN396_07515 [Epulopiscium sp. SCG-B11WGA-EpuloA1]
MRRLIILCLACIQIFYSVPTFASGKTSYTYSMDENGQYVKTQDAYIPNKTITDLKLKNPEDLFVDDDNNLYIADTGNKRIVKYSIDTNQVLGEIKHDEFKTPKGIFVTDQGDIYVADAGAKAVFVFNDKFELTQHNTKPTTPIFEETNFEPSKIAVDSTGNMYIVGEGVYSGIIQISTNNEFLGYFTVNKTILTPMQAFQKLIFSKEQEEKMIDITPNTFSNVFLDNNQGIVYTTTMGKSSGTGVKKHSTNGNNMFSKKIIARDDTTDVYVDDRGIIYTASNDGYIFVYAKDGEFIYSFGAPAQKEDIAGVFTRLPAIAVDKNYEIWAVDGEKGYLQSFTPTEYASTIYLAMEKYEKGEYEDSREYWQEVLNLNQMSILAHNGVGKAQLRNQEYESAMHHFELSGDKDLYSEAFWEVRNDWLQDYLIIIVGIVLLFIILMKLRGRFYKSSSELTTRQLSALPLMICKNPFDAYYELRKFRQGTFFGASLIYLIGFIIYMTYRTNKGYIYQLTKIEDMDINSIVIGYFAILGLFILGNYLVTSINDGLGNLKQVYMIPAYGAFPAVMSMLIVIPLSYVLVQNEAFVLSMIMWIGVAWSLLNIFIGFQTVHDYTFKETVFSLVMTVVMMIIVAVMGIIVTIMWEELYQFILSIGKELFRDV